MLPVQSRMARAATGFQIIEIAKRAKVATATIVRFEKGEELKPRTVEAIQSAYEAAGIEFIDGDAPGIRLHARALPARKKK
jgi:transcriptional regulator with XRE-family HTH domain